MTRKSLTLFIIAMALFGCGPRADEPYTEWEKPDSAYVPQPGASNSYDRYVVLADTATKLCPEFIDRVSFTETMKSQVVAKLSPVLTSLRSAVRTRCTYEARFQDFATPDPSAAGWRLIGHALTWAIEDCAVKEDWDSVVALCLTGTKFGLDLTQGDAQVATLGFAICADVRKATAPHLEKLGAQELDSLGRGVFNALSRTQGLQSALKNEKRRMLFGVQFVQECRRNRSYKEIEKSLGRSVKPAVAFLKDLEESKRPAYFMGFASEVKAYVDYWTTESERARPERTPWAEPSGPRPWKKFTKTICGTVEPLLEFHDDCIVRSRLLGLTCTILREVKAKGAAPKDLKGMPAMATTDLYSGRPLIYAASGSDFKIYSVGVDGRDDGGKSDETYANPDIVLETNSN